MVVYWLIACIVVATFTAFFKNGLTTFVNLVCWAVLAFFLYRNVFFWANRIDMSNDLKFMGARILGGILAAGGIIFGAIFLVVGLLGEANPFLLGLTVLLFGAGVLGGFLIFRTDRRFTHIYVNR